jgi:inhibitor of cysteine peptidase
MPNLRKDKRMKKKHLLYIVILSGVLLVSACQPSQAVDDYTYGQDAAVESLEIFMLESFPVQVEAHVSGYLPDGCTELDEIIVERQDQDFILTVQTRRSTGDIACTQALVPFEETVDLDVQGLSAGTYNVIVQEQEESFTLDVDNEMPD